MKRIMVKEGFLPFDETDILKSIGMSPDHHFREPIRAQLEKTRDIAAPKGFFLECVVGDIAEKAVVIEGRTFISPTLSRLLRGTGTVYPYVATCGRELEEYASGLGDMVSKFALDAIMNFYQKQAAFAVECAVLKRLPKGLFVSKATPGDVYDWDIRELRKLFELFGAAAAEAGVTLRENYMMTPLKTSAGLCCGVEDNASECRHCPREGCLDRKEAFDGRVYWGSRFIYRQAN